MNCTQCGAPIRDDSGFCDQCGARVERMIEKDEEREPIEQEIESKQGLDSTTVINISEELIREAEEKLKSDQLLKQVAAERAARLEKQAEAQRLEDMQRQALEVTKAKKDNTRRVQEETLSRRTPVSRRKSREIEEVPHSLLGLVKILVRNPLLGIDELELYADNRRTIQGVIVFVLVGSAITAISFNTIIAKIVSGLIGLFGNFLLLLGSAYISASDSAALVEDIIEMPFVQDSGLQIILYPILSHLILISLICIFVVGIFRIIIKEGIELIDCLRLMLTPLAILLIGKIGVLLLGFISGTLAAYFYVLMMFAVVVITILQFINFFGKSALIIYSMPLIYLISALIRNGIILQIIKMSMARYALYF